MENIIVKSVEMLIEQANRVYESWGIESQPWFRGEPKSIETPLQPKLFRPTSGRPAHRENSLLQHFRMKAPALGLPFVPPRENVDQWLFLAQHVRLPTRLLDWTEGLLIALHFAVYGKEGGAVVWMLNPVLLNRHTYPKFEDGNFALTWFSPSGAPLIGQDLYKINNMIKSKGDGTIELTENIGNQYIHEAWTVGKFEDLDYPWALHPTYVHPRMSSQLSRFTIHGKQEGRMDNMNLGDNILQKFIIDDNSIAKIKKALRTLGIVNSTLFPELDGVSDELSEIY